MIDEIDPNNPPSQESAPTPPQPPLVDVPAEVSPPAPANVAPPVAPEATTTAPAIDASSGDEIKPLPKRKTLSIIIHDAGVLRAAYMQFVKGGGLFIPTKKVFAMGEDTNLIIRLLDDDEPYRVSGKVVWITPTGAPGAKAGGIGVEFADDKNGEHLRSRIEVILGPHLKSTESTHTM